jgi:phosphopantothenoylcysteine decarboxylase/phosphopantothenate--cysteine ligase
MISGKRILLGVSGSIAAYKAVEVLRRLSEQGAEVRVVMTRNAARFISPLTFSVLSGRPVLTDEFAAWEKNTIGHIDMTDGLDLALVAPATANIIGKAAGGIADDALSSSLMASDCPLVMAPAMNDRMYRNAALRRNMALLAGQGVRFVEPEPGPLACGVVGQGRLASAERIIREVTAALAPKDLAGRTVLVTAGPTREPIDAVRFISNPSSGKMGYAVAVAARDRGASVIMITGPTQLPPPAGVTTVAVTTAAQMQSAVFEQVGRCHVVVMAAAVSDFRSVSPSDRKIKKGTAPLTLQLEPTDDILSELGKSSGNRLVVGFAAETDDLVKNAELKLKSKNLDLIVANDLLQEGSGFGADTNAVVMIDRRGNRVELPLMPKTEIASRIVDRIVEIMSNQGL